MLREMLLKAQEGPRVDRGRLSISRERRQNEGKSGGPEEHAPLLLPFLAIPLLHNLALQT